MEQDKKCLECANSRCDKNDNGKFIYVCCLSKKKCHDCLSDVKVEDYFKEM